MKKYISIKSQMNAYETDNDLKGFRFYHHRSGIYSFKRRTSETHWEIVQCSEIMLHNGDLQTMIEKGITLSKDRIKTIQSNFKRRRSMGLYRLNNTVNVDQF